MRDYQKLQIPTYCRDDYSVPANDKAFTWTGDFDLCECPPWFHEAIYSGVLLPVHVTGGLYEVRAESYGVIQRYLPGQRLIKVGDLILPINSVAPQNRHSR